MVVNLSELVGNPNGPDPEPDPETIPESWETWCCDHGILEKADQELAATFVRHYLKRDYDIAVTMANTAWVKKNPLCTVVWLQCERPGFPELWKHLITESKRQSPEAFTLYALSKVAEREWEEMEMTMAEIRAPARR